MMATMDHLQADTPWVVDAFQQAPFAVLILRPDDNLTVLWQNAAHARQSSSENRVVTGLPLFDAFPPSREAEGRAAVDAIRACIDRILVTKAADRIGPYRFDLPDEHGQYVEHHWTMLHSPVMKEGEVVAILQTAQDVTSKVLAERVAATRARSAESTAAISYFSYDPETDRFDRHPAIDAMFGFAPGEAGETASPFFARVHPEDRPGVDAELARIFAAPRGEIASFDYRVPQSDGEDRFLRIRAEVVTDPDDRRAKLVGSFIDLTEFETTRRRLTESVAQREALVQEANHRIKNSLQIALSMLRIEKADLASHGTDASDVAADALSSFEARVRAVADVHGELQFDCSVTTVSLNPLLDRLIASTRVASNLDAAHVHFDPIPMDRRVPSSQAVNVGLILNEWLTNAIKHGLDADGGADIRVSGTATDDEICISVDNRIADPANRSRQIRSSGIGARLAAQFAEQIGGRIEAGPEGERYVATLRCPAETPRD